MEQTTGMRPPADAAQRRQWRRVAHGGRGRVVRLLRGVALVVSCGALLCGAAGTAWTQESGLLYKRWVLLSAQGYRQAEIESRLGEVDAKQLEAVKARVREQVLTNLRGHGISRRYAAARDEDDLRVIQTIIASEIRHAGLQLDQTLSVMIHTALISGDL